MAVSNCPSPDGVFASTGVGEAAYARPRAEKINLLSLTRAQPRIKERRPPTGGCRFVVSVLLSQWAAVGRKEHIKC